MKVSLVCTCCGLLEEGEVPVHQAGEELVTGAQNEAEPDEGEEATTAAGKQRAGKELGVELKTHQGSVESPEPFRQSLRVNKEPQTHQATTEGQWRPQNPVGLEGVWEWRP